MTTQQLDYTRVPFAADLASFGDKTAILTDTLALSYRHLAERVDDLAVRLGTERRLVALTAANDLDSLVAYLAALVGGIHVLLPEDKPAALESLIAAYDPDVVMRTGSGRTVLKDAGPAPGTTCTRTWRSCSAPPDPRDRPSSSASRRRICSPTPSRSPSP